jgi:Uncharacterised nucleotidyltransferase
LFQPTHHGDLELALSNTGRIEEEETGRDASSSAAWAALLESASPCPDSARLLNLFRRVSWPDLFTLAEEHGVMALLAASVRRFEQDLVPPQIAQEIRKSHRAQVLSTLKMTAELFRLVQLFRAAALDTALVKGPTLALRAYGDPGARQYGDLDFLVRQRDILRATEVMIAAGYEPDIAPDAMRAENIPGQYLFVRMSAPLLIELHTERTMRYFPHGLPLEMFFERRKYVPLEGHDIPALAIEDELILICIHGAKHLWERLTLIADVAALVTRQTGLDWERSFTTARELGAERMLHTGLLLAHNLLHPTLPSDIQVRFQSDVAASRLARQIASWLPSAGQAPPGLLTRALFRMRMRGNPVSGLSYLLKLSFSPTQEDWGAAGCEKPGGHFASLRRPLRLARKYRRVDKAPE